MICKKCFKKQNIETLHCVHKLKYKSKYNKFLYKFYLNSIVTTFLHQQSGFYISFVPRTTSFFVLFTQLCYRSISSYLGAVIPNGLPAPNLLSNATLLNATADCANEQNGQQHAAIISTIHG